MIQSRGATPLAADDRHARDNVTVERRSRLLFTPVSFQKGKSAFYGHNGTKSGPGKRDEERRGDRVASGCRHQKDAGEIRPSGSRVARRRFGLNGE